jgi:hypothetical protein
MTSGSERGRSEVITKRPYCAQFPEGSAVLVRDRHFLEEFHRSWHYHHPLDPEQLDYAGTAAQVEDVGYYHGGDVLYKLREIPGIWHEVCLAPRSA